MRERSSRGRELSFTKPEFSFDHFAYQHSNDGFSDLIHSTGKKERHTDTPCEVDDPPNSLT